MMMSSFMSAQRGWVSLPIIALLLAISTLSAQYQQRQQASYLWRGQLKDLQVEQQIWTNFKQDFVVSPSLSSAILSECVGFCALGLHAQEKIWQKDTQRMHYQWARHASPLDELGNVTTYYRLCASQNQQQYRCWWWRNGTWLSGGWVSASD